MKTKNITVSIPATLETQLHSIVGKQGLNQFATQALQQALKDLQDLKKAYAAANDDIDRANTIADWESIDSKNQR